MSTLTTDMWNPAIWVRGADEGMRTFPSFITSGAVTQSGTLDGIASGGGTSANLPFFKEITEQNEVIQVESTAPTVQKLTSGVNVAPILNRVWSIGFTALSAAVPGENPVAYAVSQISMLRQKNTMKTAIALIRGLMGTGGVAGGPGCLSANRTDIFIETLAGQAAANLIDLGDFNATIAKMGELADSLSTGCIIMHPVIHAALKTQDAAAFSSDPPSQTGFRLQRYQGIPIYLSLSLVRTGTTDGFVYETYVFGRGVIGWGEKPQVGDQISVASLQRELKRDINDEIIYDRRRYLLHVDGTKYIGTPAGQSATNVELQNAASWQLVYSSADRIPVACIRSNG